MAYDDDQDGIPNFIDKTPQGTATASVAGDGGVREGNFIVWRDDSGSILKWSTLDESKEFFPLALVEDVNGNSIMGSGPDNLWTPEQAKNQMEIWYETDSPEWNEVRRAFTANGQYDLKDEEIYRLAVAGIDYTQNPLSGTRDPVDIINTRSAAKLISGSGSGGANYGPYRYESTDVAMSSESQAKAILDRTYLDTMGRVSTTEEAQAFQEALNLMEKMNPSKSIIQGVSGKRSDSRTQVTESGFDPTSFAREYAMSMPEYADTFAATTFMGALDRFLASPDALSERMEQLEV